jgi:tetratricopeptide (TPR) repeat protein
MTLAEELGEVYRMSGVGRALTHYDSLKTAFYGRGAYDFGEGSLNGLGYEALNAGDAAGAVRIFSVNKDLFPESGNTWDSLGEAYLESGDRAKAREAYTKSLELDPENENARAVLRTLEQ